MPSAPRRLLSVPALAAALAVGLLLAPAARAQDAVLDLLDGETLYDGGSLLSLGHEFSRFDTLRRGRNRVDDPANGHEAVHVTTLSFQHGVRHDLQLGVAIGHATASRDSGLEDFSASGLTDLDILGKWRFHRIDDRNLATNFALLGALSVPTGADDETHAGAEIEPELQPGSGSLDPAFGAAVTHEPGRWRFNAAALYRWRTDLDGDGDRRGDHLVAELAAGNRFWLEPYPGPFMRADLVARYHHEQRSHQGGAVLGDSGGERITAGLNLAFRPRPSLDFQTYFELPAWQRVNGTQLGFDWRWTFTFGFRF